MTPEVVQLPLAERLWLWFDEYKRPLAAALALAAVAALVIWYVVWHNEQKQIEAGQALSQVATAQLQGTTPRSEAASAYLKVAQTYHDSVSGAQALMMAAAALFADGKYPEAQAQFERFVREYQGNPMMGQALFGIASCLDAEGKTDQAANAYNDLITRHSTESFIPQARFALARIYETQNKVEQARDLYQEVERSSPFSSLGNEAGVRMEELIAKNPKLAPAPPAPSAATLTNLAPLLQKK